jgi:TRAP-type C4-dicarboxylate transport system permease small subunit
VAKSPRRVRTTKATAAVSKSSAIALVSQKFWFGFDKIATVAFNLCTVIILSMAISIAYSVFMRRVLDSPVSWVIQVSEYMLLFICFLAAPKILQENGHARMTLVHERLSAKGSTILNMSSCMLGMLICLVVVWETGTSTWSAFINKSLFRENFDMLQWQIYWVVPFGFLMLTIQFARMSYNFGTALKRGEGTVDGTSSSSGV